MKGTTYWLLAYLVCTAGVVGGMFYGRQRSLAAYGTPTAQSEWQHWREAVRQQVPTSGTTKRRVPKSQEPPALVLMRDHFLACTVFAVVMASALFLTAAVVLKGTLQPTDVRGETS